MAFATVRSQSASRQSASSSTAKRREATNLVQPCNASLHDDSQPQWRYARGHIAGLGFLLWNWPRGLIFLGDGGAYFIGYLVAVLSFLLVARHRGVVTPWYPFLLFIYPVFETLFSIWRRKVVRGASPGLPDGLHLHQLVFRRLVRWAVGRKDAASLTLRNSLTAPYLRLLSRMASTTQMRYASRRSAWRASGRHAVE